MTPVQLRFDDAPPPTPSPNPVKVERDRLNAAALRVLAYLQAHGEALNWQLTAPALGGLRAAGRIWELQQDGWDIRKEHVERGTWRWRFVGRKEL